MIKKSVLILDVAVMYVNAMIVAAQTSRNALRNVIAAVVTPKHIFLATN